jgi:hypothetical protein
MQGTSEINHGSDSDGECLVAIRGMLMVMDDARASGFIQNGYRDDQISAPMCHEEIAEAERWRYTGTHGRSLVVSSKKQPGIALCSRMVLDNRGTATAGKRRTRFGWWLADSLGPSLEGAWRYFIEPTKDHR